MTGELKIIPWLGCAALKALNKGQLCHKDGKEASLNPGWMQAEPTTMHQISTFKQSIYNQTMFLQYDNRPKEI